MAGVANFMFIVYILKSIKNGRYYIGHTGNLEDRLLRHNNGRSKATRSGAPWELEYSEKYNTKSAAYRREMQIKKYKGGEAFRKLIIK